MIDTGDTWDDRLDQITCMERDPATGRWGSQFAPKVHGIEAIRAVCTAFLIWFPCMDDGRPDANGELHFLDNEVRVVREFCNFVMQQLEYVEADIRRAL